MPSGTFRRMDFTSVMKLGGTSALNHDQTPAVKSVSGTGDCFPTLSESIHTFYQVPRESREIAAFGNVRTWHYLHLKRQNCIIVGGKCNLYLTKFLFNIPRVGRESPIRQCEAALNQDLHDKQSPAVSSHLQERLYFFVQEKNVFANSAKTFIQYFTFYHGVATCG